MERATHLQTTVPLRRLPAAKGTLNPPHATHQGAGTATGNQSSKASATSA